MNRKVTSIVLNNFKNDSRVFKIWITIQIIIILSLPRIQVLNNRDLCKGDRDG